MCSAIYKYRLHVVDPSRQVKVKTLGHHVAEILRGGTDWVEDAGEFSSRMFVWFEGLLVSVLCRQIRFALIEIIFAGDLVFVERLELGDVAHRPPFIERMR